MKGVASCWLLHCFPVRSNHHSFLSLRFTSFSQSWSLSLLTVATLLRSRSRESPVSVIMLLFLNCFYCIWVRWNMLIWRGRELSYHGAAGVIGIMTAPRVWLAYLWFVASLRWGLRLPKPSDALRTSAVLAAARTPERLIIINFEWLFQIMLGLIRMLYQMRFPLLSFYLIYQV